MLKIHFHITTQLLTCAMNISNFGIPVTENYPSECEEQYGLNE